MTDSDTGLRIGIDVGGTNTDAVLMQGNQVIAATKQHTTADISGGVTAAIKTVLEGREALAEQVAAVMVGTTHFVNAIVQRRSLATVATIRVGLPMGSAIPPMVDWPEDLRTVVDHGCYMIHGGAYYTGVDYHPLDEDAVRKAARAILERGSDAVAIASVFAPIRPDLEQRAETILREILPDTPVTLSHTLGGLGLIERENSAVLNASLTRMADNVVSGLQQSLAECGIEAPLFISHNDGTLMDATQVREFPVFACSAGPTNSIRGAAFLTGLEDAVVVDVGGTTSDIGVLVNGIARETSNPVDLGGVKTNFSMPDVLSVALGGGTTVDRSNDAAPVLLTQSVGYRLTEEALAFGGKTLTTTDIGIAVGDMSLGDPERVASLSAELIDAVQAQIAERIADGIDQVKLSATAVPVVVVGGGAPLIRDGLPGVSELLHPEAGGVANAIGAAIAQVGGRVRRLFDYPALGGRDKALALASDEAKSQAIKAGARPETIRVVELEELPMPYMETGAMDVRLRVIGDLDLSRLEQRA